MTDTANPGCHDATRLCERAIIRVSSEQPDEVVSFLQGLVTNDVTANLPIWTALLSPQGKVLFDFFVWPGGDDLLLDVEAAHADELVKKLSMYRLRRPITIATDPSVEVHWNAHRGDGGAADPRLSAVGQRWLRPTAGDPVEKCADDAYRAHRLALGVTEGREELGFDQTLWLECNAAELHGVSFGKGCYIGQENTARMNWRQKINRRLLVLPIEKSDEKRRRMADEELGLAVDHARIADTDHALWPGWLALEPNPAS
ncbi:CAF17-like 4Fe-4S cluster assembly/insertion protein YgfZ [Croceicoccus mobilis]|uniref:Glycine cleavage system protein T n=1 Tax=Croceicoccus mobilis TaxID=1703339 RepID=A0A917DUL1_9SPHN|nr:folate-binding protein YgfZ [Croceicoccus mobilis]GGD68633.1 glycine cleavage system protein T [Croceicoccus mobilis]